MGQTIQMGGYTIPEGEYGVENNTIESEQEKTEERRKNMNL